jgi:hypothetical protein
MPNDVRPGGVYPRNGDVNSPYRWGIYIKIDGYEHVVPIGFPSAKQAKEAMRAIVASINTILQESHV